MLEVYSTYEGINDKSDTVVVFVLCDATQTETVGRQVEVISEPKPEYFPDYTTKRADNKYGQSKKPQYKAVFGTLIR